MNQIIQLYMNGLENGQQPHRACEVMIISGIVKADDTSKESIEYSSKLGLRYRKTILADQTITASSFTRSFVENNNTYIRSVCDELSGGSNCNVTMSYGNGTTTNIMIRYDDKSGEPIFAGSLLMQIKIIENGMISRVLPKGKFDDEVCALVGS